MSRKTFSDPNEHEQVLLKMINSVTVSFLPILKFPFKLNDQIKSLF